MDLKRAIGVAANLKDLGTAVAPFVNDDTLDEVVREVAYERSKLRRVPGGPNEASEDWVSAKAAVLERVTLLSKEQIKSLRSADGEFAKQVLLHIKVVAPPAEPNKVQFRPFLDEVLPETWVRQLAYRHFEARGRQHGGHLLDWYRAKCDLFDAIAPLSRHPQCDAILNHIRTKPLDEALSSLRTILADMREGKMPPLPESMSCPRKDDDTMRIKHQLATPDQLRRASFNQDPLELLSDEQLAEHRGRVVAIALNNGHRAAVIEWAMTRAELQKKMASNDQHVGVEWALCDVPSVLSRSA